MAAAVIPGKTLVPAFVYAQQQLPTNRSVVQYIRQSTIKQVKEHKQSFELQDQDLHDRLVNGYGWLDEYIIKIVTDQGKSGTKRRDQRKGLDELYTLLEQDNAGAVAAYDVSRLYRVLSRAEYGAFCDLVLEKRIPVITYTRIYWPNRNDNDQLAEDFRIAAAEIENIIKGKLIAAKNRHIQYDASYAGNTIPFGFVVDDMGITGVARKFYRIYEPHAILIRKLFRWFRELGGNLPLLGRELKHTDFRFPPFEQGIIPHVGLRQDTDGSYPLRSRAALISILTNKAYIGWYEYGGMLVSRKAHDAIVPMDDFLDAYERLSSVSLDGTEQQEHKIRERRYGGSTALLDGIVKSNGLPVYVLRDKYCAKIDNDGFTQTDLAVSVARIDQAFSRAMIVILGTLEGVKRQGLRTTLTTRIDALLKEQKKHVKDYTKALTNIDKEIAAADMDKRVSLNAGDEQGASDAAIQLARLRKDRKEIEIKASQASREASELEKCHDLTSCAIQQWDSLSIAERKRLVRMLVPYANLIDVSPHFLRLDVSFGALDLGFSLYLYRLRGSRLFWNEQDEQVLRRYYPNREATMQALPTRTWDSIRQRAQDMGLGRGKGEYGMEPALSYADMQLMEQTVARVDKPVWVIADLDIMAQEWGVDRGLLQGL